MDAAGALGYRSRGAIGLSALSRLKHAFQKLLALRMINSWLWS